MAAAIDNFKVTQRGTSIVDNWFEVVSDESFTFSSTPLSKFLSNLVNMKKENGILPSVSISSNIDKEQATALSKVIKSNFETVRFFSNAKVTQAITDEDL